MAGRATLSLKTILLLLIAAYLIVLGIQGINSYNSDLNQLGRNINQWLGRSNSPVTLIIAIAELAAGAALLLSLFLQGLGTTLRLIVIVAWLGQIVYTSFIIRISTTNNSLVFSPTFLGWLAFLLVDVIILLAMLSYSSK